MVKSRLLCRIVNARKCSTAIAQIPRNRMKTRVVADQSRANQLAFDDSFRKLLWSAETVDNVYEMGTDTFVVRDDKIVVQSFTDKVTPKG